MEACTFPLPYEYSKYLFYSSFFMGASSFVCLSYKDYSSFLVMFVLFLSSIHYWSDTVDGIGRQLDLYMCRIFGLYFYFYSLAYKDEFSRHIYTFGMCHVIFLFFMEHVLYYDNNPKWIIFHMGVHFYSVFTPFVLYIL